MALSDSGEQSDSDSDGVPELGILSLRPEALAALREVSAQRDTMSAGGEGDNGTMCSENFGMSQFWYSDVCADALAAAVRSGAGASARIAVVSCPSVHRALARLDADDASVLFEYDPRFGETLPVERFVQYDFRDDYEATYDPALRGAFDFVVLDPPYTSRDCVERFWRFARWLSRCDAPDALFCTSVINRDWLETADALGSRLRLTADLLDFSSKLRTPLRAFVTSADVAAKLGGFAASDEA